MVKLLHKYIIIMIDGKIDRQPKKQQHTTQNKPKMLGHWEYNVVEFWGALPHSDYTVISFDITNL